MSCNFFRTQIHADKEVRSAFIGVAPRSEDMCVQSIELQLQDCAMLTRWDQWFADDNLAKDPRILAAPPSQSAENAAQVFLAREKRFVLDLACGIGRDTFYLASCGLSVVGVDAAFNGLRVAQRIRAERGASSELVATTVLVAADARRLPFKAGAFDGVYCFGLLHEFVGESKDADVAGVLSEIRRLLCDDGVWVMTVLSGEPEAGLPQVQLYTRQMFEELAQDWQTIEIRGYDDVGCTNRPDYHVWYGVFEKAGW